MKTRKTNRSVTIPIHPSLKKALGDAQERKQNEFVLPAIAGIYSSSYSYVVNQNVKKVFKRAGFETTHKDFNDMQRKRKANMYGFHSFRHSFVSFCAKAGVPLPVVQAIVGHSHPAITRHYIHLGEESIKLAIAALPTQDDKKQLKCSTAPEERIKKILKVLQDKKTLSSSDKRIMDIASE